MDKKETKKYKLGCYIFKKSMLALSATVLLSLISIWMDAGKLCSKITGSAILIGIVGGLGLLISAYLCVDSDDIWR